MSNKKIKKAIILLEECLEEEEEEEEEEVFGGITEEELLNLALKNNKDVARDKIKDIHKRFVKCLDKDETKELLEYLPLYKQDHIDILTSKWVCICKKEKNLVYRPANGLVLDHLVEISLLTSAINKINVTKKNVSIQTLAMYCYSTKYAKHICQTCENLYRPIEMRGKICKLFKVQHYSLDELVVKLAK